MSADTNGRQAPCPRCGQPMHTGIVKTAIWINDRLFVVEDIPAWICSSCIEQLYDEETTEALRRLTEEEFPRAELKREILVPVYSLEQRLRRNTAPADQPEQEVVEAQA